MFGMKTPNGKYKYGEWVKDINGELKRIYVTMDKKSPRNEKIAREILADKARVLNSVVDDSITFLELLRLYEKYHVSTLKVSTQKLYQSKLNKIRRHTRDVLLEKINTRYIRIILDQISVSNNSYNNYLKLIKSMLRYAYEQDYISDISFLAKLKGKKHIVKEDEKLYHEQHEIDEILKKLNDAYHRNVIIFIVNTGVRIGEFIALKFTDISNDICKIRETVDQFGNITSTKTYAGERDLSLNAVCLQVVEDQKRIIENLAKLNPKYKISGYIFPKKNGERNTYSNLRKSFEKRLGYQPKFHIFRHTHASLCMEAGIPIEYISNRLGHDGYEITKKIYIHKTQKMEQKEFEYFKNVQF